MESILNNTGRNENFTSSENYRLMTNGKKAGEPGAPFKEYVEEKNFEIKLGRSIKCEAKAQSLTWGKCLEKIVFEQLGIRYKECSQETIINPNLAHHAGSPDGIKTEGEIITVAEVKCPQTLKSFCQLVDCIPMIEKEGIWFADPDAKGYEIIAAVRENHKDGDKFYWQCISNAILTNARFAELIIFCPYYSQLNEVRAMAQTFVDAGDWSYNWIAKGEDASLPYLLESGRYNNLNVIRWEVSELDKKALTDRIEMASKLLITK